VARYERLDITYLCAISTHGLKAPRYLPNDGNVRGRRPPPCPEEKDVDPWAQTHYATRGWWTPLPTTSITTARLDASPH